MAYGVYNTQVTAYDAVVATYKTDKTAYEEAFEKLKKDPKTTLPKRPDYPTVIGAYDGPELKLAGQILGTVADTWATTFKTTWTKPFQGLIATDKSAKGVYSYDQANIKATFHNRASYLVISATDSKDAIGGVGATFGRLGQGVATMVAKGSPFLWQKAITSAKPGMQVSLLPEYDNADSTWADWTLTTATAPKFSYKLGAFATLSSFEAPSTPAAAEKITVGAFNLAAGSMVAAAAIASTMF